MIHHCLGQTKLHGVKLELVETLSFSGFDDALCPVVVVLVVEASGNFDVRDRLVAEHVPEVVVFRFVENRVFFVFVEEVLKSGWDQGDVEFVAESLQELGLDLLPGGFEASDLMQVGEPVGCNGFEGPFEELERGCVVPADGADASFDTLHQFESGDGVDGLVAVEIRQVCHLFAGSLVEGVGGDCVAAIVDRVERR